MSIVIFTNIMILKKRRITEDINICFILNIVKNLK